MRHITHGNLWITRGGMHPTGTVTNFDWFLCASLSYFHRSDWDQKKNVPYPSAHSFHLQCGAMSTTFGDLSCSSRPILMKWTSQHSDELIVETFQAPQIFWMFIRLENPEAHKNTKSALRTRKKSSFASLTPPKPSWLAHNKLLLPLWSRYFVTFCCACSSALPLLPLTAANCARCGTQNSNPPRIKNHQQTQFMTIQFRFGFRMQAEKEQFREIIISRR